MSKNPPADLLTFTKEIFNGKVYFLVDNTMDNEISIFVNQMPLGSALY